MNQLIENKVNELASQVVPSEWLESFLQLDIKSKLTGIMTFAQISGENEVRDLALEAMNHIQ